MELTANLRKQIAQLAKAKYRRESGLFVAEGTKCVLDTLPHFQCHYLLATDAWLADHSADLPRGVDAICVKQADIERMSSMSTPQPVMAVYEMPADEPLPAEACEGLLVALDRVQDPGNLGTIIRLCDWFGVRHILCARETADVYSPKVVQATMGAISRVRLHYCDLAAELGRLSESMPVYGTFLNGTNLYSSDIDRRRGIIVMGNEGRGISPEVEAAVSHRLLIPSYPPDEPTSESLNVAMATAIMLAEFRRP